MRKATIHDFRVGTKLIDGEGNEFVLDRKYADGVWETRSVRGGKCVFETEAHFYRVAEDSPTNGNLSVWVRSRVDLQTGTINKALNYAQFQFWQLRLHLTQLKSQIVWSEGYHSPANEKSKVEYFAVCDEAHKYLQQLQDSPEWTEFELLSRRRRALIDAFGLRTNFDWMYKNGKVNLAECLANSHDVLPKV